MDKKSGITLAKISVAISMFGLFGTAQANNLSILNASPISFVGYNGQPANVTGAYTSGSVGTIVANGPGTITFTYLGSESSFNNAFSFLGNTLNENNTIGDITAVESVDVGAINFSFSDNQGGTFGNGDAATPVIGFAVLNGNLTPVTGPDFGPFDYVLGFNDSSSGDADYDDFVVGVNVTPISAVPLPASLPLLAASLGIFTLASRRKI